jgi:alkanesulfonate monooxygenase SsuD/methylene tetrahydromethanopterin reductase-like flavin-dependent oxidoreductase (luciferase family)
VATGCFISTGRSLDAAVERARLAEDLGYESVWVTHIAGREPFTVLGAYAAATSRIRLGTGVTPIYARTPVSMAQTAVTLDEVSGGRLNLGIGVSHRPVVEGWYGDEIGKPVREMREYASIVRAILAGEDPPPGEKWRTGFRLMGVDPRPRLRVYISALSPAMLRAAGELGDGVVLWLCNPEYVERVVVPEVTKGRERAGKPLDGFDIVAAVPSALTDDPQAAWDVMRNDLIPYFSLPFYRAMIERSGFEDDVRAFDEGGADASAISERFLQALTAVGDEAAVREGLERYRRAGTTSPCAGPIPKTDFEATLTAAVA